MNKRVWSIAVALVMLLYMVCSVFVVSAADESVPVGDASDATAQLNNYASEQPALLNTEGSSGLTSVVMDSEKKNLSLDEEFNVSVSLENYKGDWAIFVAKLTYNPQELEYQGFETDIDEEKFSLSIDDSDKEKGSLTVCMLSNQDTNLPVENAALMNLKFKAIGETDNAKLSFTFEEESVAGFVDGEPTLFSSDEDADEENNDYKATSDFERAIHVYRPYLTMRLVDESGKEVTEIEQGQTVKAIVSLNQYYADESWMMMSLDLQFNSNKFKYDLKSGLKSLGNLIDPKNPDDLEAVTMLPAETEDPAKPLSICFFNSSLNNMVLKNGEVDILELTLQATGAGKALEIGASLLQEGNVKYDAETDTEVVLKPAEDYIAEHEEGTAVIKVEQTEFPYLSVEADKTALARGDTFTLKVNINDYVDPFSMMSILVDLDANAYELDKDREIVAFDGSGVAVAEVVGNNLGITILSEYGNDLKLSGGLTSGTVLEIPIKVKSNYEGTGSDISVSFLEGGNFSGDEEAGYDKTVPPPVTITVYGRPKLSIRIAQIDGETVSEGTEITSIEQGKEVRFVVSVEDFTSAWEIMTLKMSFDSDAFEYVSAEDLLPFGAPDEDDFYEFITEKSADTLLACWFNGDSLKMLSEDCDVMAFTLKVKQEDLDNDSLSRIVSAAFLEGGNYADGEVLTGENYTEEIAEAKFTIIEVASEVLVNIKWGAMQFTYNFGTWNPDTYDWDGRGWTCLNADGGAENWITVTNDGQVDITADFAFAVNPEKTDLAGLTHTFELDSAQDSAVIESPLDVTVGNAATVLFELGDLPAGAELSTDAANPTKLGTITITIDKKPDTTQEVPVE